MKKINLPKSTMSRGSTSFEFDEDEAGQNKRFWLVIGAFTALLALVGGIFIWGMNRQEETKDLGYQLSQKEKDGITTQAKSFIEQSGTWGLKMDKLSNDNVMDLWYLVRLKGPNNEMFFTDRQSQYKTLKNLIEPGGNISFNNQAVEAWDDQYSRDNMLSFKVQGFQVDKMAERANTELNPGALTVTVPVSFQSVEYSLLPTGTDSAWDGKFKQMQQTVQSGGTLTMVKSKDSNDTWKIKDIQDVKSPYVLSTWDTPGRSYADTQFNLRQTKVYQGKFANDYYDSKRNEEEGKVYGD